MDETEQEAALEPPSTMDGGSGDEHRCLGRHWGENDEDVISRKPLLSATGEVDLHAAPAVPPKALGGETRKRRHGGPCCGSVEACRCRRFIPGERLLAMFLSASRWHPKPGLRLSSRTSLAGDNYEYSTEQLSAVDPVSSRLRGSVGTVYI